MFCLLFCFHVLSTKRSLNYVGSRISEYYEEICLGVKNLKSVRSIFSGYQIAGKGLFVLLRLPWARKRSVDSIWALFVNIHIVILMLLTPKKPCIEEQVTCLEWWWCPSSSAEKLHACGSVDHKAVACVADCSPGLHGRQVPPNCQYKWCILPFLQCISLCSVFIGEVNNNKRMP